MSDVTYDFAIEVLREGTVVGRAAASLAPCIEDICFRAVVCGEVANDGIVPPLAVEPVWHDSGPPVVTAVRVSLNDKIADVYGRDVFAPRARAVIADLLREKQLAGGDAVAWRLVAAW